MKKNRFVSWLILILILIVLGILIIMLIPKSETKNSIASEQDQNKSALQKVVPPQKSANDIPGFNISRISKSEWNTPDGLPFSQVPGANLGATSFVIIDKNRIAYLCNSTNEIIITEKSTGKSIKKFQVSFAPRDFVYENGIFYVLSEYEVTLYNETGNMLKKHPFPNAFQGIERLVRNNDATYLLLPSGNSLMIENRGISIKPVEYDGIITGNGQFITTQIGGNNSFSIKVRNSDDSIFEKSFSTDNKVAGVFVVGATDNRVIIDVQTFISENPIAVERVVESIDLGKNRLGDIINRSKVPDCYYVISNKDFYISETVTIYNMMTSPKGIFVFSLTETNSEKSNGYPASLIETKFHPNDNLIKLD